MAQGHTTVARPGSGFGPRVIELPPALAAALKDAPARMWSEAEVDMLRRAYPIAARAYSVRALAEQWHTLGRGFPRRTHAQLSVQATRLGCTGRRKT